MEDSLSGFVARFELSKDTSEVLQKEAFTSSTAIKGLTADIIDSLPLKLGEKAALKVAIMELHKMSPVVSGPVPIVSNSVPSGSVPEPARAQNLDNLLGSLSIGGGGDSGVNAGAGAFDPQAWLRVNRPNGETALLIPDFLPTTECLEEVALSAGSSVCFKTGQKTKLTQVAPSQWISANARIMASLIQKGRISSTAQQLDYLAYTAKVGELAGRYSWVSVLHYDNEYRLQQAAGGFRWGADSQHLATTLLREKQISTDKATTKGQRGATKKKGPGGKEICLQYNAGKCTFGAKCNFEHVCLTCNKPGHGQVNHRDNTQDTKEPTAAE